MMLLWRDISSDILSGLNRVRGDSMLQYTSLWATRNDALILYVPI
jgi:hypothetical protein